VGRLLWLPRPEGKGACPVDGQLDRNSGDNAAMVRRGQKLGRAAQTAGPMWKERDGGGGGEGLLRQ
jgi:hypothetical protein